jgi:hypothetical protein
MLNALGWKHSLCVEFNPVSSISNNSVFKEGMVEFTTFGSPSSTNDRLSAEEAKHLGFPALAFSAHAHQVSWNRNIYAGLRQFHAGNGFDPDSQDAARHVGVPLYQSSAGSDAVFAHGELFLAVPIGC